MASTYIYRTPSSTGSNTISTFSAWLKKQVNGSYEGIFTSVYETGEYFQINFEPGNALEVRCKVSSSYVLRKITSRKFRDNSAFYHIVVTIDTTDSTAEDRVKIYVNGTRETSFSTNTNPSSSQNLTLNTAGSYQHRLGRDEWSTPAYFDGIMAHVHWVDGTAYQASTFGETDSTSGIWVPKTSPSVTYGTNGFFFKFENSGNMDLDSSGNNLTFTTGGTLTQGIDTPSNNFATLNALQGGQAETMGLMEGNLYLSGNGSDSWRVIGSTLAASSGKFYWEGKVIGGVSQMRIGICDVTQIPTTAGTKFTVKSRGYGVDTANLVNNNGNVGGFTVTSFTTNDILMFALDLDNSKFYVGKNGTWMNSGVPTSGSTGTGAASITSGYDYTPCSEHYDASANFAYNFGRGYFRTTAVASAGTSPSGGGIFEYDCPSGYQSWCTKGINTF